MDTIPTTLATAVDICTEVTDITYVDQVDTLECDNNLFVDGFDQVLVLIVRTHFATDECGNTASCTQHILIRDDTPPTRTCPDDITIQCDQDPNDLDLVGQPIVTDLCDPDAYATILVTLTVYSDPCSTVLNRVWGVTDWCGNGTSGGLCQQRITIVDTTPPAITCPDDITVECGDPIPMICPIALDNCTDLELLQTVSGTLNEADPVMDAAFFRYFGCIDDWSCGNRAYDTYEFTVVDPGVYVFTGVFLIQQGFADGMGGVFAGTFDPDNPCDNFVAGSDDDSPEFVLDPQIIVCLLEAGDYTLVSTTYCTDATFEETDYTWTIERSGVVLSSVDSDTLGSCPALIIRTHYAEDECGNISSCTQHIYIEDTTAPAITCPDDVVIECGSPLPTDLAVTSDVCDDALIVTYVDEMLLDQGGCQWTIIRTHYATDECDNRSSCTQIIRIVDTTPPTITCPLDTVIECGEPLPVPMATADDICDDDVFVTLISEVSTSRLDGTCLYRVIRTYRAEDNCGLSSSCTQTITIQDTTPPDLTCPEDSTITCEELTCLTFDTTEVNPFDDPIDVSNISVGGIDISVEAWSKGNEMRDPTLFDTDHPAMIDDDLGTPNVLYGGPGMNSDHPNGFEASNNQPRGTAIIVQDPLLDSRMITCSAIH
jgi:hypothetical protein